MNLVHWPFFNFFCVVNNPNPSFLKRKEDLYVHFNERLIKMIPFNF